MIVERANENKKLGRLMTARARVGGGGGWVNEKFLFFLVLCARFRAPRSHACSADLRRKNKTSVDRLGEADTQI